MKAGATNHIPESKESFGATPVDVPVEVLSRIEELYESGQCLQAWRVAEAYGPLKHWRGGSAQTLAGRLAANLGGHRLCQVLHWLAWREDKNHPGRLAYYGHNIFHRRGPIAALEFLDRYSAREGQADRQSLAFLWSLRADLLSRLRDFAESRAWLKRAAELDSGLEWLAVVESGLLEMEDRYSEALEAARRSLELRPWYRPGVQAVAHGLQLLDRDEEALAFLTEASQRLQNMHIVGQLLALQIEQRLFPEAEVSLARFQELAPMMEEAEREWLLRQRVWFDCLRNKREAALAGARQIEEPYYRELSDRLEAATEFRRVRLDVPFVRQHHQTCVPATLSAISRFWGQPADHLEMAEAICYDGTALHSQRHWAEAHGWAVREFTVTWESAVALLDLGIPFTLATSQATNSHLQAVVGYEEIHQTLWIRDPFVYYAQEFHIRPLLEQQRSTGPRGMALVPVGRAALLAGLEFPDTGLYDQLYQVERALTGHHREEALRLCGRMQEAAPDHRLTLTARRALAAYDGNTPAMLECLEQLLKQFPGDGNLTLCRIGCLRELARREERLAYIEQICTTPGTDPVFWQQYAQELRADARQYRAAASWARWALRFRPTDATIVSTWADLLWDRLDFARGLKIYRVAACLADKVEHFSQSYFLASRQMREVERGLEFLRQRVARLGRQSSGPAITLVETYQILGRTGEALDALQTAMGMRAQDANLKLFGADFLGRLGRIEPANKLLAEARGGSPPGAWHRAAANLAGFINDKKVALEHWREVLKLDPLAQDAIRDMALLLAETEGRQAAIRFLDELCGRFPFSCPLLTLRVRWSSDDGAEVSVEHLRRLLTVNPADAWGWRELALKLASIGKLQEALEAADHAIGLEPNQSTGHSVRGGVLAHWGRVEEAHTAFAQAVRLEVDNEYAVGQFVATALTLEKRKAALAEVAAELRRQVIFNFALQAYRGAARGVLNPEEVLGLLREAHEARPDLWQAWSVLIGELLDQGRHEEALRFAQQASERFPLQPHVWTDLACVHRARLDAAGEFEALEKALETKPDYMPASRQLVEYYLRHHEADKARALLQQAIASDPLDAVSHAGLADVLWRTNERDAAIARVQHVLRLNPGYNWGWDALREWGKEIGRPALAREMAEDLTRTRAGEDRSWLMLAASLSPESEPDQFFGALDRALVLNPRCEDAYDMRAKALTQLNRFEEALGACAPSAFSPVPAALKLRAAWIEGQRGNLAEAIAKAEAVLEEYPDFYGGWQLLSDWYLRSRKPSEAIKAAEKMVSLAPLAPVPLGYLGNLKLQVGDRTKAKEIFTRAFSLDPDYEYAGVQLFELQLGDQQVEPAETTLKVLQRRGQNPRTLMCAVKLQVRRCQFAHALESLRTLCVSKESEHWILSQAFGALDSAGRRPDADKALDEQIRRPGALPVLASFWVDRQVGRGKWGLHKRLRALLTEQEAGRSAVLQYLDRIGQALQHAKEKQDITGRIRLGYHFRRLMKANRGWLREDVEGWGRVGYVLSVLERPGPVIDWLQDWKNRPRAESWMLYNLALVLSAKGQHDQTREIIRHAVNLRHHSDLYEVFRSWAAFEEAMAGNLAGARAHLGALPQQLGNQAHPVRVMTELLLALNGDPDGSPKLPPREIRAKLEAAFGSSVPRKANHYVRNACRRFLRVAGKQSFWLRLWGWGFYHGLI